MTEPSSSGRRVETCQVLDGEGMFHEGELAAFIRSSGLQSKGVDYQVVAIMGPQSSGKSTLMNHVFGTTFQEMDAERGRQQTTKGVWLARAPRIDSPATLVLDLEGTDGRERGEDDTNFERQSALFALAVADVLLVNIWCHDIGREQASGKPLLKTIFQVNLKLFTPEPGRRRTVLLFVIRDKSKTPLERLVSILEEDLHRMWASITKPAQYADTQIDHFFELQYAALHSFEAKPEDFVADTVVLRRRFTEEGESSLVRATERLPADTLALSTSNIWKVIKSQKDLNLPAHKVMVANIRCAEIKADQVRHLTEDQAWTSLVADAGEALVPGFGTRVTSLLESCLQGYDLEAAFFDASVRAEHRVELVAQLEALAAQPYSSQLALLGTQQLAAFDKAFAAGRGPGAQGFSAAADSAASDALSGFDAAAKLLAVGGTQLTAAAGRAHLQQQIKEHVAAAQKELVEGQVETVGEELRKAMAMTLVDVLTAFKASTWPKLHAVRAHALKDAQQQLSAQLKGLELAPAEAARLNAALAAAADKKLQQTLQEAALTRVSRMKDAFHAMFSLDESGTPRSWRPTEDIPALARQGRLAAAQVLAGLATVRGRDYSGPDAVESAVMAMANADLGDKGAAAADSRGVSSSGAAGLGSSSSSTPPLEFDLGSASSWRGVPAADVLLAPHDVRSAWREFMSASALSIQQAQLTQAANRAASRRAPPIWALLLILLLGWNELAVVLWNPLYWVLAPVAFILGWQVYSELDVDTELERGAVPGFLALWNKLGSSLRQVAHRNLVALQDFLANPEGTAAALQAASPVKFGATTGSSNSSPSRARFGSPTHAAQPHQSASGLTQRRAVQMADFSSNSSSIDSANAASAADSRKLD